MRTYFPPDDVLSRWPKAFFVLALMAPHGFSVTLRNVTLRSLSIVQLTFCNWSRESRHDDETLDLSSSTNARFSWAHIETITIPYQCVTLGKRISEINLLKTVPETLTATVSAANKEYQWLRITASSASIVFHPDVLFDVRTAKPAIHELR